MGEQSVVAKVSSHKHKPLALTDTQNLQFRLSYAADYEHYKQDTVTQMAFFCSELMAALMCVLISARLPPCTTVEKRCEYSCSSLQK